MTQTFPQTFRAPIILAFLLLLGWNQSFADEVVLEDGTRIYGKVKKLEGKKLEIRTRHMGLVRVNRDGITELRTEKATAVELDTGERWTGALDTRDGVLVVTGDRDHSFPLSDVVRIEELEFDLWDNLEVEVSGGLSLSRGTSRSTTYRIDAGVEYDNDGSRSRAKVSTTLDEQQEAQDRRRSTLDLGQELWSPGKRFSIDARVNLELNEAAKLDSRSVFAGTVGYKLLTGRPHRLEGVVGLAWINEEYVGQTPTEDLEILVGFEYRFSRRKTRLTTSLFSYPDFAGRVLVQFDGKLKIELVDHYDFDVTFYDRYDSAPPIAIDTHDYGITVGLGWSR